MKECSEHLEKSAVSEQEKILQIKVDKLQNKVLVLRNHLKKKKSHCNYLRLRLGILMRCVCYMYCCVPLCTVVNCYVLLCTVVYCCLLLCTVVYCYVLLCIVMCTVFTCVWLQAMCWLKSVFIKS